MKQYNIKKYSIKQRNKGFSLVELMIVVAIIGILAGVAYPSYVQHVKKAQCADAMNGLLQLAGRMEELFMNTDSYATATVGAAGTVGSDQTSEGLYTLSVPTKTAFDYLLRATPDDATQVTLTLDSLGQMAESAPAAAGPSTATSCLN